MAIERGRRVMLGNENEPRAGDNAYGLYDKTHPVYGLPQDIARARRAIRGLRGKDVVMTVKGWHKETAYSAKIPFIVRRRFVMKNYEDAFGPSSAYASAIHSIRERFSDHKIVVTRIIFNVASEGAGDSEE